MPHTEFNIESNFSPCRVYVSKLENSDQIFATVHQTHDLYLLPDFHYVLHVSNIPPDQLWHQRLGHISEDTMSHPTFDFPINCKPYDMSKGQTA